MPATFALDGALNAAQGGNDTGAACTGIGTGSNNSGQLVPGNFTVAASDFIAHHIGDGPLATSASNTGNVLNPVVTVTAGSGYTNGTYRIQSTGGGVPDGTGEIQFVIAAGALTTATITRAGSGFTSNPTWTIANAVNTVTGAGPGGGTGGALLTAIGLGSQAFMLGAAFGSNKNTQFLQAAGTVANGAAITPSTYLNRSGRTMVAGDVTWAVEP